MPGFFVSNSPISIKLKNMYPDRCVEERINALDYAVMRNTLSKFMDDKAFVETDRLIVVTEGFILNRKALLVKYQASSMPQLVEIMYARNGDEFFSEFRGGFSGALMDKVQKKWIVYTNHTGVNSVFYSIMGGVNFCAGSQVNYVVDACKAAGVTLTLDENAVYQMLTYGFMADDSTYANEIKRLRGGTYILAVDGRVEVKTYHTFHKHLDRFQGMSEDDIIEALDDEFRHAVQLEYEKDEEYGYRHLADLSGGLDSRMSMWVAHDLKPRHIQLITYCKANYLDEKIAKEIAKYWNDELLVKPLDDMSFMYEVDETARMLCWGSLYCGITGGKRMLETLNMNLFGLEHTGMIGDAVIGSCCSSNNDLKNHRITGMYSERLKERLLDLEKNLNLEDRELFFLCSRGFQGASNTFTLRKNYTEGTAPFLDVDFFQLCMDIPLELRIRHRIYKRWILRKYPEAAKFKWESINAKITTPDWAVFLKKVITKGPQKVISMINKNYKPSYGMNPLDYWFKNNSDVREYMDRYESEGYDALRAIGASTSLLADMKRLYETGNVCEKSMVLTVQSASKAFFGE